MTNNTPAGMFLIHDYATKDKYIAKGVWVEVYDSGHDYSYIMYNRLWSEEIGCIIETKWVGFLNATIHKIPIHIDEEELLCEPEETLTKIKKVMSEEFI